MYLLRCICKGYHQNPLQKLSPSDTILYKPNTLLLSIPIVINITIDELPYRRIPISFNSFDNLTPYRYHPV
ncbi:hypothetical protein SAP1_018 [Staphylococcus phage StAP1]|nr:hypothetical protein SAP1_018 [Staphylococcus phage StAP1]UVT34773.1 hypothetical protein [Staphylococcus phage vB_SauM-V1SA20]